MFDQQVINFLQNLFLKYVDFRLQSILPLFSELQNSLQIIRLIGRLGHQLLKFLDLQRHYRAAVEILVNM